MIVATELELWPEKVAVGFLDPLLARGLGAGSQGRGVPSGRWSIHIPEGGTGTSGSAGGGGVPALNFSRMHCL